MAVFVSHCRPGSEIEDDRQVCIAVSGPILYIQSPSEFQPIRSQGHHFQLCGGFLSLVLNPHFFFYISQRCQSFKWLYSITLWYGFQQTFSLLTSHQKTLLGTPTQQTYFLYLLVTKYIQVYTIYICSWLLGLTPRAFMFQFIVLSLLLWYFVLQRLNTGPFQCSGLQYCCTLLYLNFLSTVFSFSPLLTFPSVLQSLVNSSWTQHEWQS